MEQSMMLKLKRPILPRRLAPQVEAAMRIHPAQIDMSVRKGTGACA
jgi:hypothetical protein